MALSKFGGSRATRPQDFQRGPFHNSAQVLCETERPRDRQVEPRRLPCSHLRKLEESVFGEHREDQGRGWDDQQPSVNQAHRHRAERLLHPPAQPGYPRAGAASAEASREEAEGRTH